MAHNYVKDDLQLDSTTGRISFGIVATLAGGVLLLCSVAAGQFLYDDDFYPTVLGAISALLLGKYC